MRVSTFSNEASWIEAALAELRVAAACARAEGRATLTLCLAGGQTPAVVYRAMSAMPLEGLAAELWLGDERVVPAGDPARNGAMIARAFAGCAWNPPPRLRPWPEARTEEEAPAAVALYEAELVASLGREPSFDLALLGLGADGHTASVFRDARRASSTHFEGGEGLSGALAAATRSPMPPHARMTLTLGALRKARRRLFLVRGSDKLEALRRLEAEDPSIPASALAGQGAQVLYLR